jgi:hypothetical protein
VGCSPVCAHSMGDVPHVQERAKPSVRRHEVNRLEGGEYLMVKIKNVTVILYVVGYVMILGALVSSGAPSCAPNRLESYLHRNVLLAVPPLSSPPPADLVQHSARPPISPLEACGFAIEHFETKGIRDIVICEVHWIAAPLSGYLVDGKGTLTIDHEEYTIFRIGITDGFDQDVEANPAGEEFVFMAFGKTPEGTGVWYPRPGPDDLSTNGEAIPESFFIYEFLLQRERFETLSERYP